MRDLPRDEPVLMTVSIFVHRINKRVSFSNRTLCTNIAIVPHFLWLWFVCVCVYVCVCVCVCGGGGGGGGGGVGGWVCMCVGVGEGMCYITSSHLTPQVTVGNFRAEMANL